MLTGNGGAGQPKRAYLDHYPELGGPVDRVQIARNPFLIGRSRAADLTIYSHKVSKEHARISEDPAGYRIEDLSSTNGTFVNGKRIAEGRLLDGDILHVAHWEFGFCLDPVGNEPVVNTVSLTQQTRPHEKECLIRLGNFLHELVSGESIAILFQSIVDLRDGSVIGCEALGRGRHHRLHQSPVELFQLAEKCQMERELCRLFRNHALRLASEFPCPARLFLNIHPSELGRYDFLDSLAELSIRNRTGKKLVVEISERSITSATELRTIKRRLEELSVEIAYDDFGAGQARLLELVECPPHFLKLDRSLVLGIENSPSSRDLVRAILSAIAGTETQVIAEGIETQRSAELCRENGCHLGQGFLFGRPGPLLEVFPGLDLGRDRPGPL
jgi:EAL domain-containing protein (putative c-di-GMP-specific phosphodiesterase class I)